jgi:hypothetical protein
MALTAADKAEIRKMIAAKTGTKKAVPRKKRTPSKWDSYFEKAINEAKKEFKANGGNWKSISAKYLKKAKQDYQKAKK